MFTPKLLLAGPSVIVPAGALIERAPPLNAIVFAVMLIFSLLLDTEAPPPGVEPRTIDPPVNETPDGADTTTPSLTVMGWPVPVTRLRAPVLRVMLEFTVIEPTPESPN